MWRDRQEGSPDTVMARVLSTAGVPGKAFAVASTPNGGYLEDIKATELSNGDIAITWTVNYFGSGAADSIQGRIFHANGTPVGAEITIATAASTDYNTTDVDNPALVALDDGRWMAGWIDKHPDGGGFGKSERAYAAIYNADGSLDQGQFLLLPEQYSSSEVQMTVLADGRVAVRNGVFVQIIDPRLGPVSLLGTNAGDQLQGTIFGDAIDGGNGRDNLAGMAGNDLLAGGAQGDRLTGGDGNDTLNGGADNGLLQGGTGNDLLSGGLGDDVQTGGLGNDSFVFARRDGQDRVTDFKLGAEKLDLHSWHFATATEALSHVTQTADGAQFAMGSDTILLLGIVAADLGATSLTL